MAKDEEKRTERFSMRLPATIHALLLKTANADHRSMADVALIAIETVCDWYRAGVDVERRIPWLSTYLGHTSPVTTYWYLTATPELLTAAAARAERAWKVQP